MQKSKSLACPSVDKQQNSPWFQELTLILLITDCGIQALLHWQSPNSEHLLPQDSILSAKLKFLPLWEDFSSLMWHHILHPQCWKIQLIPVFCGAGWRQMDNEIQGSMVGLWFSKNYVAPPCLIIIWEMRWVLQVIAEGKYPVLQASNEKEKMGMEIPHLSTVTVQGWPQKRRTGLSTGQKPQFKTVLTHHLIIPILTCPEAEQTCLGCPVDTPARSLLSWELPRATVPTPSCPAWMLHP